MFNLKLSLPGWIKNQKKYNIDWDINEDDDWEDDMEDDTKQFRHFTLKYQLEIIQSWIDSQDMDMNESYNCLEIKTNYDRKNKGKLKKNKCNKKLRINENEIQC